MITRDRYVRDTYKELDISELPPGEVLQTSWNGDLIFVRRLTKSEVDLLPCWLQALLATEVCN